MEKEVLTEDEKRIRAIEEKQLYWAKWISAGALLFVVLILACS